MTAPPDRLARLSAILTLACAVACSAITGAQSYGDIAGCTGPACALTCTAQGGTWSSATMTCTCAEGLSTDGKGSAGASLCNGLCCDRTAPYCVTTATGVDRCSACTQVAFECGSVCCEGQTCLNAGIGACGAEYGVPSQSCAGGLTCQIATAGGAREGADCCQSIPLPGGTFEMGESAHGKNSCPSYDVVGMIASCDANEDPAHSMTLAPYALDRFEVTVGRFRKFVDAWDYAPPPEGAGGDAIVAGAGWQSRWNAALPSSQEALVRDVSCMTDTFDGLPVATWTDTPGLYESLPINCVTWYEAFAFCVWDGGRLPTEAEWEFAAANGPAADLYPWGEEQPTLARTVYNCSHDPTPCTVAPPFPSYVGSRAGDSNMWGHRDLAGNVSELTLDSVSAYSTLPLVNYANTSDGFRVVRGGNFIEGLPYLRATERSAHTPTGTASGNGFRCARLP